MPSAARILRIGNEDLNGARHVCALFDGVEEARAVTLPFLVDGLLSGERIVYLTGDPGAVKLAFRAAIADSTVSGTIDVRAWTDTYIADERFSAARMQAFLRSLLRGDQATEGGRAARGRAERDREPLRLVGEMEWADDSLRGVEEIVAYEAGVDAIVDHSPHVVICCYDVRRHSASRIAAVAGVHQVVYVGGRLQKSAMVGRGATPRERILGAASRLFGAEGIRAVGVDAIIAAAGVAKATFYRHFPSKDDLIVAWLEDPRTRWFDSVRGRAEALADTPDEIVPAFYRALADWIEAGDYRGCPYLNTAVEIADPTHPAVETARAYLREIQGFLSEIAAAAGCRDPKKIGTELQALAAGAITLGVSHRSTAFAVAAGAAAMEIVRQAATTVA